MKTLLRIANGLAAMVYGGWVFSWMWAWFIAAPFGVKTISAAEGAGVVILVAAVTSRLGPADLAALHSWETAEEMKMAQVIWPWIIWTSFGAIAWLWHAIVL